MYVSAQKYTPGRFRLLILKSNWKLRSSKESEQASLTPFTMSCRFSYMSRLGLNGSDTSLPPSARTLTVLHLVSDAIRNDPNGDIPNSAAKLQRIFGLCKKKTKLFNGLWPINKIYCLSRNKGTKIFVKWANRRGKFFGVSWFCLILLEFCIFLTKKTCNIT